MDFLYQIDEILTDKECQHYIQMFDNKKIVEDINDKHRKYHRIQFCDKELADNLYEKVKHYIPKKIKNIAVGMNDHIRLSKYDAGQFFGIHKDGLNFTDNRAQMSYATLNIFLNCDFEGGETTFYEKNKRKKRLVCKPRAGRGVFFYSQQFHEGNKIIRGNKFLLRTDLMISCQQ
jgi:predicted 2-oxoglutarate/Fe(II)-dependent dioxygenase YbiX